MKDRHGLTSEWVRDTNRKKLLKALEKHKEQTKELTFTELLNLGIVSVGALNTHLKVLLRSNKIEKSYSKTKDRVVYRLTTKGIKKLQIENMIYNFGLTATYTVFSKKLNIKFEEDINAQIDSYVKAKSKISAKKYMEYLKENYPLEI